MKNTNNFLRKNTLHNYTLKNDSEPNLHKDIFPYSEIPKVTFNQVQYPMCLPDDIWITDTTFRDGQQSMSSFTVDQIVRLYDYLHELDNGSGVIKQTEFFYIQKRIKKQFVNVCQEDMIILK